MVFPVDRCGPKDKVEEGPVEDLFDFVSLPSLGNEGGFILLGSYCRRSVCRECPRGIGEANERLSKHRVKEGQTETSDGIFDSVTIIRLSELDQPIKIKILSILMSRPWVQWYLNYRKGKKKVYLSENPGQ